MVLLGGFGSDMYHLGRGRVMANEAAEQTEIYSHPRHLVRVNVREGESLSSTLRWNL
jgi:hypothetical protein